MPPQPALPGEACTAGFGHVSWKTGTSHGFRDAWAAGICGDHVLLVWVGDFDGRSNGDFTGRTTAGPLLFQALARLDLARVDRPVPEGLTKTDLCAVSGHLPGPHCGHSKSGWYLPGVSPVASCELHQEIYMDGATGLRVAANDGRPGLVREVYECWPPEMLELFRKAGLPRRALPPMESSAVPMAGGSLRITSPQSSLTYSLRASRALHRTIPLRVDAAAGVRSVFWFAGNEFLGSCDPGQALEWKAAPGVFRIRAVDDCGRSSTTEVRVEMLP